jgi:hypothetical protein
MHTSYLRFLKLTSLATDLGLSAPEIGYLARDKALAVNNRPWPEALATDDAADPTKLAATDLTAALLATTDYAQLKAMLAPRDLRLLALLAPGPGVAAPGNQAVIALTGWDGGSVKALLRRYFQVDDFASATAPRATLRRLVDGYRVVATTRIGAEQLISVTTNDPDADTAVALQAAVRALYVEADWLSIVQPINDELRDRQRDALVAYILLHKGPGILAELGIAGSGTRVATSEDLFNYFLMDPLMEPCIATSRIRHALSSVQLFIERGIRNLEPTIHPGDFQTDEWPWRKRYRVWQACREVFLWPENWMHPSLRTTQSALFKQAMSALLQSDITDDSAAAVYVDYLTGLEAVARLDPCGMFHSFKDGQVDVVHAVAQTPGTNRKCYYRKFALGSWRPWEEIKIPGAKIDGDPLVPYVWQGRLLLFWLQIIQSPATAPGGLAAPLPASTNSLAVVDLNSVNSSLKTSSAALSQTNVGAVLCFSELVKGMWTPMKTSALNNPVSLGTCAGSFDRSQVTIRLWTENLDGQGPLYVELAQAGSAPLSPYWYQASAGSVFSGISGIRQGWWTTAGFVLHNTHSEPVRWSDVTAVQIKEPEARQKIYPTTADLVATLKGDYYYYPRNTQTVEILTDSVPARVRQSQPTAQQWESPFLMADARNAFFVTTADQPVAQGIVIDVYTALDGGLQLTHKFKDSDVRYRPHATKPGEPNEKVDWWTDPSSQAFQNERTRAVLTSANEVAFKGTSIGPTGRAFSKNYGAGQP